MNKRWSYNSHGRAGRPLARLMDGWRESGSKDGGTLSKRLWWFRTAFFVLAALILLQLFRVQLVDHKFYEALAMGQHEIYEQLFPTRGEIFVRDRDGALFPVAVNRDLTHVWADVRQIDDPTHVAKVVAEILGIDELELKARLSRQDDPYEPIAHLVPDDLAEQIRVQNLPGIYLQPEQNRAYPEAGFGGHVLGFMGSTEEGEMVGRYGLEGYYEEKLAGKQGFLRGERDPAGRLIAVAGRALEPASDGADLILTIDRKLQFFVCEQLYQAVEWHGADGGSVVVLNPKTGAVMAMCGAPDFDPNNYREVEDASAFNNPAIFTPYEPGSVFKAITMAAALDTEAVGPQTTYVDEGVVQIGPHSIRNADQKAHGEKTMTQVLEESLNTGAIFAMREAGAKTFRSYVERFGFDEPTGIDLETEVTGNISSLYEKGEIYPATASFGQGVSVTTLQLAAAFAAIANEGKLMQPYVVEAIRDKDGRETVTTPILKQQVISERTATLLSAMLASVVERGHGKRAGVEGYYIAGKTGTAQVPKKDGSGYDSSLTIGSFAGFGPVDDPVFAMVVRIDHPRDVRFAESSAAPLFGKIAQFLLQYYQVPPTR